MIVKIIVQRGFCMFFHNVMLFCIIHNHLFYPDIFTQESTTPSQNYNEFSVFASLVYGFGNVQRPSRAGGFWVIVIARRLPLPAYAAYLHPCRQSGLSVDYETQRHSVISQKSWISQFSCNINNWGVIMIYQIFFVQPGIQWQCTVFFETARYIKEEILMKK